MQTERLKSNGSLEREETIRIKFSRDGTNIGKTLTRLLSEKRCACKYQNNSDNLKESLADKRKLKENTKENTRLSSS